MEKYIIYKITNPIGQKYIGQTDNFQRRVGCYKRLNCKGQQLLYKSLKHYGFENHTISILSSESIDRLNVLEEFYIKEENSLYYNNKENGLNLTVGGKTSRGNIWSEESRKKLSSSKKGKPNYKLRNRKFSKETISKMSQTRKNLIKEGKVSVGRVKVIQFTLLNQPIKEWESITSVACHLNRNKATLMEYFKNKGFYKKDEFIYKELNNYEI